MSSKQPTNPKPSKKKRSKKSKPVPKWSLYPDLHNDVSEMLREEGIECKFYAADDDEGALRKYDSRIMGRFACHNNSCLSHGWGSRRIPITIRLYNGNRYNARVYHQHCRACNSLSRPTLDQSYAERVSYRLMKWNGVDLEPPPFSWPPKNRLPHESKLCEGCKAGHCTEGEISHTTYLFSSLAV